VRLLCVHIRQSMASGKETRHAHHFEGGVKVVGLVGGTYRERMDFELYRQKYTVGPTRVHYIVLELFSFLFVE